VRLKGDRGAQRCSLKQVEASYDAAPTLAMQKVVGSSAKRPPARRAVRSLEVALRAALSGRDSLYQRVQAGRPQITSA
jgi:hypothetical protein